MINKLTTLIRNIFHMKQKREDILMEQPVSPTQWLEAAKAWKPNQTVATKENYSELIASWRAQVSALCNRRDRLDAARAIKAAYERGDFALQEGDLPET
jgi:hypothetical protein